LPALQLAKAVEDVAFQNSIEKRVMYLTRLEEEQIKVVDRIADHQSRVKKIFDKKSKQRNFQIGDL
ncbi:hypothetical protein KI387_014340, partial [Taxus chinensis]